MICTSSAIKKNFGHEPACVLSLKIKCTDTDKKNSMEEKLN